MHHCVQQLGEHTSCLIVPTHLACQTQLEIDSMTGVITDSRMLKSVSHALAIQLYAVSDRKHASAHYRCWISGQSCKILFALNTLLLSRQITASNHFPARSSLNSVSRAAMPQSGCWSHFLYKSALKNKSQCMCETWFREILFFVYRHTASSNCFHCGFIPIVTMLASTLLHVGPLAVQSWWYMLGAFVAMAICQDAFLAILIFWKRPVSTGHV